MAGLVPDIPETAGQGQGYRAGQIVTVGFFVIFHNKTVLQGSGLAGAAAGFLVQYAEIEVFV